MKRRTAVISMLGLATAAVMSVPSVAACSPPCGPIPAILDLQLDKWKGLTFGQDTNVEIDGVVSFYVDVDRDGFYYDPDHNPILVLSPERHPPWLNASVTPNQFEVPVDDPQYLGNDAGGPDQVRYYWEAPFHVTVTKSRDPTPEELAKDSRWVRYDGTNRVTLIASSTASLLMADVLGPTTGLQEGFTIREIRFVPEIDGVAWTLNDDDELVPSDGNFPGEIVPEAESSSLSFVLVAGSLVGLTVARRRLK